MDTNENYIFLYIVYNKAKGIPYKLLFLKRIWKGISPGQDPIADGVFLYPQVSISIYYYILVVFVSFRETFGGACSRLSTVLHL